MKRKLTEIAAKLNRESCFDEMPKLIFMTDQNARAIPEEVIDRMPEGSMVILRDYDHEDRAELAKALLYVCRSRKIKFLVAGDLTLSLMVGSDGIHVPEYMQDQIAAIKEEHPDLFISTAAHNEVAVNDAEKFGADAVLLAPIFPTHSHPDTFENPAKTIGVQKLKEICEDRTIAIYALGGINHENAEKLSDTGIAGFAAIRGI